MAKENKIKDLTDVLVDGEGKRQADILEADLKAGLVALESGYYKQAWDHFYGLYAMTFAESKLDKHEESEFFYIKGEAAYGLCKVMQEVSPKDDLIQEIMTTDPDLVRKAKTKSISPDFARKFVGRKYLKYAADDCGNYGAMIEYAQNCVASGHSKSFVFDYNDRDAQIGVQWANRILLSGSRIHKAHAYMIHAKYHFARFTREKNKEEAQAFCENVMAGMAQDESNEYVKYFYAHICSNPNFQTFEGGKHFNPKRGYELFAEVMEIATDPDIASSARNIKTMLETKYPQKIK
jgi:hypothetical protein